jgi:lipoate-protein ligase A
MSAGARPWRLILATGVAPPADGVPEPLSGARNMAVDQALFESVQNGAAPVLRLYRWEPACLSLGRNQLAHGVYDPIGARAEGIDVVRRPTGGLAVLHAGELTYAVIAPAPPLGGPRAAYFAINEALVTALRALGVPAQLGAGAGTHAPSPDALHPCFERPAPGEVVAADRKLVGSAQRVERHTILQHGSILCTGDQDAVTRLQHGSGGAGTAGPGGVALAVRPRRGEITLAELLGSAPPWAVLAAAVRRAVEARLGIALAPALLSTDEGARAAVLTERFGSDDWTWRR